MSERIDPFHPEIVGEMYRQYDREDAFAYQDLFKRYCWDCGELQGWADLGGLCEPCWNRPQTYGGERTAELLINMLEDIHVVLDSSTVIDSERAEYERKYGVGRNYLYSDEEYYQTARKLFRKALNFAGR